MKNKKRKIIVLYQEDLIVCDNPKCDFKIKNETGEFDEETIQYVNMPCPKCGDNLLTEKDYLDARHIAKIIHRINKWFGWLSIFFPLRQPKRKTTMHIHNGININHE